MTSNTSKKDDLKRLFIYVFLAFAISWIPAVILNKTMGYHEWFETSKVPFFGILVGFGPAIANVLTRLITKEGWSENKLHLCMKNNLKYYIIAISLPIIITTLDMILNTIVLGGDLSAFGDGFSVGEIITILISSIVTTIISSFITFGEELGWRGYMNQKLERLIGTTGTIIVGGIIWGLWHAELTVEGHNFGTDYPGFPYMGIVTMCIYCTFLGMPLMWLTKKTGSVYPAAILHGFNNYYGMTLRALFAPAMPADAKTDIPVFLGCMIPGFILCAVFMVMLIQKTSQMRGNKSQ